MNVYGMVIDALVMMCILLYLITPVITTPSAISNLSSLQEITLANNQISGTIPLEITSSLLLPSLRILDLNNNQLNGDIPFDVDLPNLQVLDVSYNSIDGTISESIGNSRSLVVGKFQSNDTNGQMPQSICENASTGNVQVLESDCSGGENAQVTCGRCTSCL